MAIIHCPSCNRRMSSIAKACPHCHEPIGQLDSAERGELARRRWRGQLYRARNLTYLAMGLVVAGSLVWRVTPPRGLMPPVGPYAALLLGLGLVGYVASWSWFIWLRYFRDPDRANS